MTTTNNGFDDNLTTSHDSMPPSSSWLSKVWNALADALNRELQPRISCKFAHSGHRYWHPYDPISGQSASLGSEADVLWWLDQLHH